MSNKKGFTIIELIVVIAIIAVLAAIVVVNVRGYTIKARNDARIATLVAAQKALVMYYADNGNYPSTGGAFRSECANWGGYSPSNVIPGLAHYMAMPSDPTVDKANNLCCFMYISDGTDYVLLEHNCPEVIRNGGYESQPSFVDPLRDGGSQNCVVEIGPVGSAWAWQVSTPGGCTVHGW